MRPPRRVLNKILKPRNTVTITVYYMLIPVDLKANSPAFLCVRRQSSRDRNVLVNRVRDRFSDSYPVQDRTAMTAAHKRPSQRHNRQVMGKALQGRIATGPPDAVEENVAIANGGNEAIEAQIFDKQAMIRGHQTPFRKHRFQTSAK
jgi:hypothetical protein